MRTIKFMATQMPMIPIWPQPTTNYTSGPSVISVYINKKYEHSKMQTSLNISILLWKGVSNGFVYPL